MTDRPRRPDEDVIAWALETGRILDGSAWRTRLAAGQATEQTLASLNPVDLGPLMAMHDRTVGPQPIRPAAPVAMNSSNPLVDGHRAANPTLTARAMRNSPAPTLFPTGDLPAFTASGVDPQALLQVPWQARHAVARAATTTEAYSLLNQYGGPEGELLIGNDLARDPANQDYERRVGDWIGAAMTEDEVMASLGYAADDDAKATRRDPGVHYGASPVANSFRRSSRQR